MAFLVFLFASSHLQAEQTNSGKVPVWFEQNVPTTAALEFRQLLDDLGGYDFLEANESSYQRAFEALVSQSPSSSALMAQWHTIQPQSDNTRAEFIADLPPAFPQVSRLRIAIRQLKANYKPGLGISPFQTPRLGGRHPNIAKISQRLLDTGFMDSRYRPTNRLDSYDPVFIRALKAFQAHHGLEADGVVGAKTIKLLNRSNLQERLTLQANLRRWMRLPHQPSSTYLEVNIANFDVRLVHNGKTILRNRAIVGTPNRQTPIFSSQVRSVTINPMWRPTNRIIWEELVPSHRKNSSALTQQGFALLSSTSTNPIAIDKSDPSFAQLKQGMRLVQLPGKQNALGKVRFNFHNTHSVYLHDTPQKHLFNKNERALSHGCVRVQDTQELVAAIERIGKLDRSRDWRQLWRSDALTSVKLTDPINIHLTYQTGWIDEFGQVQIRDDIYHLDSPQIGATDSSFVKRAN
ncbi:L,D-transpeptidase family protein [Paraferrimonas sedimenticola]|uniref:L,D-transpeptidase family protein n=1 Tax=Paraferrimonas sedimenticola TaxID=375674 RepID=UPI0014744474|nr:L,D-transpeptidase family protein [Paraferrimonas sedimenticola]